jgi:hypothetical protein
LDGVQLVLPCEHKAVAVVLARCIHKVEGEELEPLLAAVLTLENLDLQQGRVQARGRGGGRVQTSKRTERPGVVEAVAMEWPAAACRCG